MVENQPDSFRWGQPALDYIVPEIDDVVDALGERIGDALVTDLGLDWDIVSDEGFRKAAHPDLLTLAKENTERTEQRLYLLAARVQWLEQEGYPIPSVLRNELQFWSERHDLPEKISTAAATQDRLKTAEIEFPEINKLDIWDKWRCKRKQVDSDTIETYIRTNGNGELKMVADQKKSAQERDILAEMAKQQLLTGVTSFDFQLKDLVASGDVSQEEYEKFERLSRLNGFRMRVFVADDFLQENNDKLSEAVKNAGALIYGEMGWDSCLETMEQIPAILSRLTHNGVVITYDMPGQLETTFTDPEELRKDPFLYSHQGMTMAVDLALRRLFGLDGTDFRGIISKDDEIKGMKKGDIYQKKIEVTIGHSRRGAAQLYKGYKKWFEDDKVGYVLLNPVFKTGGMLPFKDWQMNILGLGSDVFGSFLQTGIATKLGVGGLLEYLATGGTKQVKKLHQLTFQKTPVVVISETINHLAQEHLAQFPPGEEKYSRVRVYHAFNDRFVPNERTLKRLLKFINGTLIIPQGRDSEDHYFFSYLPGHLPGHQKNRFDVCVGVLDVLRECGWVRPERPIAEQELDGVFFIQLLDQNPYRCVSFVKDQQALYFRYK